MSFFIILVVSVAIVGQERDGMSRGVNPSCTCKNYARYANYAKKNAIYIKYIKYIRELTLVTALVTAVGVVTLGTTAVELRLRLTMFCSYKMQILL